MSGGPDGGRGKARGAGFGGGGGDGDASGTVGQVQLKATCPLSLKLVGEILSEAMLEPKSESPSSAKFH